MLVRGQEHFQRELLVPPVHPKTALTALPRCTVFVVAMQRNVDHWASTNGHTKEETQTCRASFFFFFLEPRSSSSSSFFFFFVLLRSSSFFFLLRSSFFFFFFVLLRSSSFVFFFFFFQTHYDVCTSTARLRMQSWPLIKAVQT